MRFQLQTIAWLLVATTFGFCQSAVLADEPFDYFQNSWNVIGLKDYNDGTRVTPDNELILAGGDKAQLRFGKALAPLSRKQTKTLLHGWMPIILLSAQDGAVRYDFTLWATPLPTVKDWRKAYDWPTEGENFLNWITVKVTNTGAAQAEAKYAFEQTGKSRSAKRDQGWLLAPGESAEDCVLHHPAAACIAKQKAQTHHGHHAAVSGVGEPARRNPHQGCPA